MKNIATTQEAYDRLKSLKEENIRMSFTDVILMLLDEHEKHEKKE